MKILLILLVSLVFIPESHAKKRYFRAQAFEGRCHNELYMDEYDGPVTVSSAPLAGKVLQRNLLRTMIDWSKGKQCGYVGRACWFECIVDDSELASEHQSAEYKAELAHACDMKTKYDEEIAAALLKRDQQIEEIKRLADLQLKETVAALEAGHEEEMEMMRGIIRGLCGKLGVPVPPGI